MEMIGVASRQQAVETEDFPSVGGREVWSDHREEMRCWGILSVLTEWVVRRES